MWSSGGSPSLATQRGRTGPCCPSHPALSLVSADCGSWTRLCRRVIGRDILDTNGSKVRKPKVPVAAKLVLTNLWAGRLFTSSRFRRSSWTAYSLSSGQAQGGDSSSCPPRLATKIHTSDSQRCCEAAPCVALAAPPEPPYWGGHLHRRAGSGPDAQAPRSGPSSQLDRLAPSALAPRRGHTALTAQLAP